MLKLIEVDEPLHLRDYAALAHLAPLVQRLRSQAELMAPMLSGRTVWMINSTEHGGGVAEMLPKMVTMLRELGVDARWAVLATERQEFFGLTKRIHNMIHGVPEVELSAEDRALYDAVSRETAEELKSRVGPKDILAIHDPQPLGVGARVKKELGLPALWRCHIGLDKRLPVTRSVWSFLQPYATLYDHAIFSAPEYIPAYLAGRASIIHPGIDPLSHKNRDLYPNKLTGILCNSHLAIAHEPVLTPQFPHTAKRLHPGGEWGDARDPHEIGLLYRPTVLQISRWDRLKGFAPLIDAFVSLKANGRRAGGDARHRHRLELLRLILAGPDPHFVADDPEAKEVLGELAGRYRKLDPELQRDVILLTLPMNSRKENALMVNGLQRCATIVIQNSIREGFGLTIAEAMWKRLPVVASRTCGARQQIVDRLEGRMVDEPENPEAVAEVLNDVLADHEREVLARNAQRRVYEDFLIFTQLSNWLRALCRTVES